jgi:hypothetical protein
MSISNVSYGQVTIYNSIISKLDNIKNNILKIKEYTELNETKQIEYLEILNQFSKELNNLDSLSNDLHDMYILQLDPTMIKNHDQNIQKDLLINKKINDTFLPYILYMQIMLRNS